MANAVASTVVEMQNQLWKGSMAFVCVCVQGMKLKPNDTQHRHSPERVVGGQAWEEACSGLSWEECPPKGGQTVGLCLLTMLRRFERPWCNGQEPWALPWLGKWVPTALLRGLELLAALGLCRTCNC